MTNSKNQKASLILEDGTIFEGNSFGFEASCAGEVVFNTGMVGYNESLTDPSYSGQILCLTYPLIGNYGVPAEKPNKKISDLFESDKIHATGLVVANYSQNYSHFAAQKSLSNWLKEEKIPAITGIDTRALTKRLREKGVMLGKIVIGEKDFDFFDPNKENLVQKVSCTKPVIYGEKNSGPKVVLVDCGAKNNIVRELLTRKCVVHRVPWDYDFFAHGLEFDAVVLSNGPGDPKMCHPTIKHIKKVLQKEIPLFGICLGNQLLGLAATGDTFKLKYGHRGQNQPCKMSSTKKCIVTSQNHGFALDMNSLAKDEWSEWFSNLNDGTNEGIIHKTKPWMSVQFHPEATPGPTDAGFLFDEFLAKVKIRRS